MGEIETDSMAASIKLHVAGRVNDFKFQKAKSAAESLEQFHGDTILACVDSMVPAEWDQVRTKLLMTLGGVALTKSHKSSPLVWTEAASDGQLMYVGDLEATLEWANSMFGYTDTTKDLIYNMRGNQEYKKFKQDRPCVFLKLGGGDLTKGNDGSMGRVVIELFNDIAPLTCENFRCLCTGERGAELHYKGVPLHRVVKDGWLQGGDLSPPHTGAGGESVYGGLFADECFTLKHDQAGLVGMANHGASHTNGSQFYITLGDSMGSWDGKYVVFGRVIEGMRTMKQISNMETNNDRPVNDIIISDCGMC